MTNKNKNWHKAWQRLPSSRLRHVSGLEFEYEEALGWSTCDDTMEEFQRYEFARGVPLHDIFNRTQRLLKEAVEWHKLNP